MKIEIGSQTKTIDLSTPQRFARALTSPDLTATVTTVVTASDHTALLLSTRPAENMPSASSPVPSERYLY